MRFEAPPFSLQWEVTEGGTLTASDDGWTSHNMQEIETVCDQV